MGHVSETANRASGGGVCQTDADFRLSEALREMAEGSFRDFEWWSNIWEGRWSRTEKWEEKSRRIDLSTTFVVSWMYGKDDSDFGLNIYTHTPL